MRQTRYCARRMLTPPFRAPTVAGERTGASMRQRASEWFAGWRLAPFYLLDPELYRPHVVVWVEAATGKVPGAEVMLPDATAADAAEALVRTMGASATSSFVPPRSVCT